ncbi:hypothetical protein BAE44_0001054 [Dichanthelium oligosanthes]|uniref:MCAfunc domain-containing protein n=1 Tax=Dichanthelium oligosanthes TaxID=888268 RepID=A0A1E5WKL2_9POAL|nr:hypothetical protein BAE44_0001054 [Dichanthelium oligosanthes]
MVTSWDNLGRAASVMQVAGVDAFGPVSMILRTAGTARRNRDECQQLAERVQAVRDVLEGPQIQELTQHPTMRGPLDQLTNALLDANDLVNSCQQQENQSLLQKAKEMIGGDDVASKLRLAKEKIDGYITLIILTATMVKPRVYMLSLVYCTDLYKTKNL